MNHAPRQFYSENGSYSAYTFPAGYAGVSYSVNGYTWETTGPLTIGVDAVTVWREGTGQSWGGVEWLGYTQHQIPGIITTTLSTPINVGSIRNQWMLFLPKFPTSIFADTSLPDALSDSQLAADAQGLAQGAFSITAWDGTGYFFNFGDPIPEPTLSILLAVGALLLAGRNLILPDQTVILGSKEMNRGRYPDMGC